MMKKKRTASTRPSAGSKGLTKKHAPGSRVAPSDLATFPALNPNPIVEVDSNGQVLYLNPEAKRLLPGLKKEGFRHPWLRGMAAVAADFQQNKTVSTVRRITFGKRYYEQAIYVVKREGRIRIYGRDVTERKKEEAKNRRLIRQLSNERTKLKAIIRNAPEAIIVTDAKSRIVMANSSADRLYRKRISRKASAFSMSDLQVCYPDGKTCDPRDFPLTRSALDGETCTNQEMMMVWPDGQVKTILASTAPLKNDEGEFLGAMGIFQDISERIEARKKIQQSRDELELRVKQRTAELQATNQLLMEKIDELQDAKRIINEQAHFLNAFFRHTKSPVVFLDKDFNFIRVNEAYARICAREVSEFPGRNHFDLYPSDAEGIFRRVVETKESFQVVARPFVFPDHPEWGITYWDWTLVPILDQAGEVEFLVFSLSDVTDRKKSEMALQEREKLLGRVLETLPLGVWIADKEGRIVRTNPAGREIWGGFRPVDIPEYGKYKGWWLETGKKIEAADWGAAKAILKGETSIDDEIEIECFDGTRKIVLYSAVPIRDGGGAVSGAIIVHQDITERKLAEKEIRESHEQLRALSSELILMEEQERKKISAVLHDRIAQMLAAGRLKLTLLSRETPASNFEETVRELRGVFDQLIGETRALMMELTPPALYELGFLPALEWLAERMTIQYGIPIECEHVDGFRPPSHDMQVLLFHAVRELLLNVGRHSMAEKAKMTVCEGGSEVQIMVRDDGRGFDGAGRTKPGDGGGFGLFSIRERLKYIGGRLDIHSRPREGATVILTAPKKLKRR